MIKGKGLLDRPGVRERIDKKVEEVKKMYFEKGIPLAISENGKRYNLYADGKKEEIVSKKKNTFGL